MRQPGAPKSKPAEQRKGTASRILDVVRNRTAWLRDAVVNLVVDALILLVLVALVWAVADLARELYRMLLQGGSGAFRAVTVEALTVFIFIEIFQSLVEFLRSHRVRISHLIDASFAFVLREVWVKLYEGHADWRMVLALAALVLSLGGVRTLAVLFSPSRTQPGDIPAEDDSTGEGSAAA